MGFKRPFAVIAVLAVAIVLGLAPAALLWAQAAPPPAAAPFDWKTAAAAVINTAGVMAAVWVLNRYLPAIRQSVPWLLPVLAGAAGPAVAALQAWLAGYLGVVIDLGPVLAAATGASAVAVHQVWKQATKPPEPVARR